MAKIVLQGRYLRIAKRMLLDVVDILNSRGVVYHLEGGTLLGIVRDGELLPWDKDMDISIPASEVEKFLACVPAIRMRLWRVTPRRFDRPGDLWKPGDLRVFKVRNRSFWFFGRGRVCLDVFVKYDDGSHVYCIAAEKILRCDSRFYESYEEVEYEGRKVKVPNHYLEYLETRYGDWKTPVKEWDCATDDRTVYADF